MKIRYPRIYSVIILFALDPIVCAAGADVSYESVVLAKNQLDNWRQSHAQPAREGLCQWFESRDRLTREFSLVGGAFVVGAKGDARRWDVLVWLVRNPPEFLIGWKPGADLVPGDEIGKYMIRDAPAQAAWRKQIDEFMTAFEQEVSVPEHLRASQAQWRFSSARRKALLALQNGAGPDPAPLRLLLDSVIETSRGGKAAVGAVREFLDYVETRGPVAASSTAVYEFIAHPIVEIREYAETRAKQSGQTMQLKFTALDGRSVDLREYKGKIVLIQFWATWCPPCIAEIPGIMRAYEAYHVRGFEVIGISLDRQRDRAKLERFVNDRKMPWPQHFEGASDNHSIARQFGIVAIPRLFLLDRSGRFLTMNLNPHDLDAILVREFPD